MSNLFTQCRRHPSRSLPADLMPWIMILLVLSAIGIAMLRFYLIATQSNVQVQGREKTYLYIPTGSDFGKVMQILSSKNFLKNSRSFEWLARRKHYDIKVKPGRYRITNGMNNNMLVNLLRSGKQEPVRLILQGARTREDLAGKIGRHLETDSAALSRLFNDPSFLCKYEVSPATLFVLFLPNTYNFSWNTSGDQLFVRMTKEYRNFWTDERKEKSFNTGLTIPEIVTLASIIEKETNNNGEKPVMAGVYINRLRKGIPLQADPTVIYAWNDYSIRRVLAKHTEIKSSYNTYRHKGLPPGPICIPSVASVDAVLNRQVNNYLYFCAKEDLTGSHNFAATLSEHNQNARRYQAALNKLNIR